MNFSQTRSPRAHDESMHNLSRLGILAIAHVSDMGNTAIDRQVAELGFCETCGEEEVLTAHLFPYSFCTYLVCNYCIEEGERNA